MSDEWYSSQPRSSFSKRHREELPQDARMIDLDQVLFALYVLPGEPIALIERKPEQAKESFWHVTLRIAQKASLPAFKIVELNNGLYRVYYASAKNGYEQELFGDNLTLQDWYEQIELPLRKRAELEVAA